VQIGAVRFDANRFLQVFHGKIEFSLVPVAQCNIVVRLNIVRAQFDGFLNTFVASSCFPCLDLVSPYNCIACMFSGHTFRA
jgi:hypothetical protein